MVLSRGDRESLAQALCDIGSRIPDKAVLCDNTQRVIFICVSACELILVAHLSTDCDEFGRGRWAIDFIRQSMLQNLPCATHSVR
jgi:hypothetical protein